MAEKKRGPLGFLSAASFPYRRKSLLSPAELEFYNVLKDAIGIDAEKFSPLLCD